MTAVGLFFRWFSSYLSTSSNSSSSIYSTRSASLSLESYWKQHARVHLLGQSASYLPEVIHASDWSSGGGSIGLSRMEKKLPQKKYSRQVEPHLPHACMRLQDETGCYAARCRLPAGMRKNVPGPRFGSFSLVLSFFGESYLRNAAVNVKMTRGTERELLLC